MAEQKKILIISTGGTFNKVYNPLKGALLVDEESNALKEIASKWLCDFKVMNIIGKDSLDMSSDDRLELLAMISRSEYDDIIVIHGTDTMSVTAEYLADADVEKRVVLTGAMVPFSIDPVEATANLASAYGFLQLQNTHGVYIAMNALADSYKKIEKNRKIGKFVIK